MAGFIDGDLVEKFIDLPRSQMEEIMKDLKVRVCKQLCTCTCIF